MLRQLCLQALGFRLVRCPIAEALVALGQLHLALGFLQLRLQVLHLIKRQNARGLKVFEVFLTSRRKQRLQFGQSRMLLLQLGQHLRELALQDVFIWDQLGAPAAGGDGLEVRREVRVVVGEGAAHLVARQQVLTTEESFDAFQQRRTQGVDIARRAVLIAGIRRQCIDHRQVRVPPGLQLRHEVGLALQHTGVLRHVRSDGALVGQRRAEVGVDRGIALTPNPSPAGGRGE